MEITGRLTRDAEVREFKGKKVVSFNIALNETYVSNDEKVQKTEFVEVGYWGGANVAKLLSKGVLVQLSGWIQASAYLNKEGKAVGSLKFTPSPRGLEILAYPNKKEVEKTPTKSKTSKQPAEEDDLPF